jgi:hypothetical protein
MTHTSWTARHLEAAVGEHRLRLLAAHLSLLPALPVVPEHLIGQNVVRGCSRLRKNAPVCSSPDCKSLNIST